MKCLPVFFLYSVALLAQPVGFQDGQAARLVIGQPTFTAQDPNSSDTILGGVSGLAYGGDTLFIADANRVGAIASNHRVLLFKGVSSMLPSPTDQLEYNIKCPVCTGRATVVLGQPDFVTTTESIPANRSALRLPTAVATDGVRVVVADTNHNRVLIWNQIPSINNQQADVVIGQPDFTSSSIPGQTPNEKSMRGPQGVWIGNGRLYVADTQNNRVLVYNRIPTTNGAAADVVLGAPNFTTFVQPDLTQASPEAKPDNMLNPVSVTSDGTRLFVTDLGHNRVLVWNSIPSSNGAPADFALGQPDLNNSVANYGLRIDDRGTTDTADDIQIPVLCTESNGKDDNDNPTYPVSCKKTLNFPRFALSNGTQLFIADGGNDRVLVYNTMPTQSGAAADYVIGAVGGSVNQASDAADSFRTPMSLAWDGTNLYVSDAYNRRVTAYSIGRTTVPYQGVKNAASLNVLATGGIGVTVAPGGTIRANDEITITIADVEYKYTTKADDTILSITQGITDLINSANAGDGDPKVLARGNGTETEGAVFLTSKVPGPEGNDITLSVTTSTGAQVSVATSGSTLTGGADAAKVAPGTVVAISGTALANTTASADLSQPRLPTDLAGVQVYFNGIRAPLFMVSPEEVRAQIPWEIWDTSSINAYVRTEQPDGSVAVTTPVAATIVKANPGIFAVPNSGNPAVGLVYHGSSSATGIVSVDGSATANDTATIKIEDRSYTYTVQTGDTLNTVRDRLIDLINQDPKVFAYAAGQFDRIVIQSRVQGPEGNGIPVTASASSSATVILSALMAPNSQGQTGLCCANVEGAPVTEANPAVPGEILVVYATGLGLPILTDANQNLIQTGVAYPVGGPETVPPFEGEAQDDNVSVSSLAGGKTADVLSATLQPGTVGTYRIVLHLNSDLPNDTTTSLTIAQGLFVSNIVTFPVVNPNVAQ